MPARVECVTHLQRQFWIELKLRNFLCPWLKFFGLWIDVVVEDCACCRELNGLEVRCPPFGEFNAIIDKLHINIAEKKIKVRESKGNYKKVYSPK